MTFFVLLLFNIHVLFMLWYQYNNRVLQIIWCPNYNILIRLRIAAIDHSWGYIMWSKLTIDHKHQHTAHLLKFPYRSPSDSKCEKVWLPSVCVLLYYGQFGHAVYVSACILVQYISPITVSCSLSVRQLKRLLTFVRSQFFRMILDV